MSLSLSELKRQLALEEAGVTPLEFEAAVPTMASLQSPTTRTMKAIIQNKNHFDLIKGFLQEADDEERAVQSLVDEAEAVQKDPIRGEFNTNITATSAILDGLPAHGSDQPPQSPKAIKAPEDESDGELDDEQILSRVVFTLPRNQAGSMIGITQADSSVLAERPGKSVIVEPNFILPPPKPFKNTAMGEDVSENATVNSRTVAYEDGRSLLKRLMNEQTELMEKCEGEQRQRYDAMMRDYTKWQDKRGELFGELLKLDDSPSSQATGREAVEATESMEMGRRADAESLAPSGL